MATTSRKATKTEAKTETQTKEICPVAQSTLWAAQADAAMEAAPDQHPMAKYRRSRTQFATMALALVKKAKGGKIAVSMEAMIAMGFNPKVKDQSFWGTGKHYTGARAVSQLVHGLGYHATVADGKVEVENGVETKTKSIVLEKIQPCGRFAPTK